MDVNTELLKKEADNEVLAMFMQGKVSKEEKDALIANIGNRKVLLYLIDQYYQSQEYRIRAQNQARSLLQGFDDNEDKDQLIFVEKEVNNAIIQEALNKKYMDIVTKNIDVCRWMREIVGIGPIFSAYLYASFDVKAGKYNTNFLSYAGLNDNNNPWLGNTKANELVDEAVEYRQREFFDPITSSLRDKCGTTTTFNKLQKALKKIGKAAAEDKNLLEDIKSSMEEIGGFSLSDFDIGEMSFIVEYAMWLNDNKSCDDILYNHIAEVTGRNIVNVIRGTKINRSNKKGNSKTPPDIDDLVSYLAKPPYNTELKKKMYLLGEQFAMRKNNEKSLYGKIYAQRKLTEIKRNNRGEYAEQAAKILEEKNYGDNKTRDRLMEGKLSDGHLEMRARRYAVKLFISHVFEAMYYAEYGKEAPKTYIIEHGGHHDYIPPEVDYHAYIN